MNKGLQKAVISKILKKHGIDPDTVDLEAEIDSKLSLKENLENISKKLGYQVATTITSSAMIK
jgi:hypothetical protein